MRMKFRRTLAATDNRRDARVTECFWSPASPNPPFYFPYTENDAQCAKPLQLRGERTAVRHIRAETFLRLEASFLKPDDDGVLDPQEALMDPTFDSVRSKYLETPVSEGQTLILP